ncbi:MAG: flagellar hook-basal body complex protein FliE [Planctomycetes bacterium]|nr:flagellar hook-basal body complex protein FliE [Planctomycetota bacterium]
MSGIDGLGPGLRPILPEQVQGRRPASAAPGAAGEEVRVDGGGQDGSGFAAALMDSLRQVDDLSKASRADLESLGRGEPGADVTQILMSSMKSEAAFNLMLEVRNKLVEAWQTLSRSVY